MFIFSIPGVTDFPTADKRPVMNVKVRHSLSELQRKAIQLSSEVKQLKQMQLANMSSMKDTIQDAFLKIKVLLLFHLNEFFDIRKLVILRNSMVHVKISCSRSYCITLPVNKI